MALFILPDAVLSDILSAWIVVEELQGLDFAICSKQHRKDFLNIISGPHFVIPYCSDDSDFEPSFIYEEVATYLVDRKIKVACLILDEYNFHNGRLFHDVNLTKIKHLTLSRYDDIYGEVDVNLFPSEDELLDFIHSLPELCSLQFIKTRIFRVDAIAKVNKTTLSKITELDLDTAMNGDWISAKSLDYLADNCKNLKTLRLPNIRFGISHISGETGSNNALERSLCTLIRSLKMLEHFSHHDNVAKTTLLDAFAESCPKLKSLRYNVDRYSLNWASVDKIFHKCTNLIEFECLAGRSGIHYDRAGRCLLYIGLSNSNASIPEPELMSILNVVIPHVYVLRMSYIPQWTRVLDIISEHGSKIVFMEFVSCGGDELVNNRSAVVAAWKNIIHTNSSVLEYVKLSDACGVDCAFLLEIFASAPNNLNTLELLRLPELDTETVIKIIDANPQLKHFSCGRAQYCPRVDYSVLMKHLTESERNVNVEEELF